MKHYRYYFFCAIWGGWCGLVIPNLLEMIILAAIGAILIGISFCYLKLI